MTRELIDKCAADFDIRYALSIADSEIYVAYYEPKTHKLKIAKRDASGLWTHALLGDTVNWDSHKYITMTVDSDGYIHLSGNMHNDPLVYYRSEKPGDIFSMKKMEMTGSLEESVTYPEFLRTNDGLFFHYREGRSGNGSTFINRYDLQSKQWEKLSDQPLFDGMDCMNAYFKGPFLGPDNRFHMIWCWRDTSDCSTNHGLYYASSADLKIWSSPAGGSRTIPITPDNNEFMVDDVKAGGGLINGGFAVGFDDTQSPVIAYHKYDENDHTNIYLARTDGEGWNSQRVTDWKWKWEFSGRGSVPFLLDIKDVWADSGKIISLFARKTGGSLFSSPKMQDYVLKYDIATGKTDEEKYNLYPPAISKPRKRKRLVHLERDRHNAKMRAGDNNSEILVRYETEYPTRDKRTKKRESASTLELITSFSL